MNAYTSVLFFYTDTDEVLCMSEGPLNGLYVIWGAFIYE